VAATIWGCETARSIARVPSERWWDGGNRHSITRWRGVEAAVAELNAHFITIAIKIRSCSSAGSITRGDASGDVVVAAIVVFRKTAKLVAPTVLDSVRAYTIAPQTVATTSRTSHRGKTSRTSHRGKTSRTSHRGLNVRGKFASSGTRSCNIRIEVSAPAWLGVWPCGGRGDGKEEGEDSRELHDSILRCLMWLLSGWSQLEVVSLVSIHLEKGSHFTNLSFCRAKSKNKLPR
jgi:hypothetical protein